MGKIYILEGPDGTGKTTLANAIMEETKGHMLHGSYSKDWDIRQYHMMMLASAINLSQYQDVVIDRWAPSEWVYGSVFRGGASYDVFKLMGTAQSLDNVVWVMCRNDKAVMNHLANATKRLEMFEDMTDVVANFTLFKHDTSNEITWLSYDYDKVDMNQFVKEITT